MTVALCRRPERLNPSGLQEEAGWAQGLMPEGRAVPRQPSLQKSAVWTLVFETGQHLLKRSTIRMPSKPFWLQYVI